MPFLHQTIGVPTASWTLLRRRNGTVNFTPLLASCDFRVNLVQLVYARYGEVDLLSD
jgi:hypothetical protein